jgi:D-alanyl-D-alanine carboxypeptidase/D-alanyl-D-alanine-endopeptidase (penicillin-binding protein 4)
VTSSATLRLALAITILNGPDLVRPAAGQSLTSRLTIRLDTLPLDRHVWGIAVLDPQTKLLYGRNADRLFMPASNTKLLVTAAATWLMPPGWAATTALYPGGPIVAGVLKGDLVLYGGGDPTWTARCYAVEPVPPESCTTDPYEPLRRLAGSLRRVGLTTVTGAVIGDGSYFEELLVHPTWESDDLLWSFAAPVSGLGWHENMVIAQVSAGPTAGARPMVTLEPDLPALVVEVAATTGIAGSRTELEWRRRPEGNGLILSGSIALDAAADRSELAVTDPNRFAALAFARVLADSGVEVLGGVRSTTDPDLTRAARTQAPLATVVSRPVEDWIFAILNVSHNWMAETLLKQLGKSLGRAGSWAEGLRIERRFLIDSIGVDSTQVMAHDGSGLSAKNLASPLAIATVLTAMRRHPRFAAFAAGLPRSGATGSLQSRFLDTPVATRVRAKTGSIGQVNSLSGYLERDSLLSARRPCRIFSIQANHHTLGGRAMIAAIDSVVVETARGTPCGRVQ